MVVKKSHIFLTLSLSPSENAVSNKNRAQNAGMSVKIPIVLSSVGFNVLMSALFTIKTQK